MGRVSARERRLVVIMLAVMAGWITSPWHHIPNAFVALAGVSAILISGVLTLDRFAFRRQGLGCAHLVRASDHDGRRTEQARRDSHALAIAVRVYASLLPWFAALAFLVVVYLYIHYSFASMTAHITALYPGFFAAALAAGAPPLMAALVLAYFSNLNAGITHYGTGSAPVYFGLGYISQATWWKIGFLISVVNLVIWFGIGSLWWKTIGLW